MSKSAPAYTQGEWTSADGLTLRYRDFSGPADRLPVLCIPGLTRNSRDFEPLIEAFPGERRFICPDLRGRGRSDYAKDTGTYHPQRYAEDIAGLLDNLGIERAVMIGTSLGGIVIMLLATMAPERVAAAVLNDVGPEIEARGLARIREYVGLGRSYPTWMHAARGLKAQAGASYPDFELSDWLRMAKRMMAIGPGGRIAFDYDMKIAEPFHEPAGAVPQADLWLAYRALTGRPVLVLRGEMSDILSDDTMARMAREIPDVEAVTVPRTGHTPTLEEPAARLAIERLLAKAA